MPSLSESHGFVKSMQKITDPRGKTVVIFGAGGAARAISVELALAGATDITIVNRTVERGQAVVDMLNEKVNANAKLVEWDGDYDIPEGTDIVINATSIGLYPDVNARLAINTDTLTENMVVSDVVFNPPQTRLIRDAEAKGCTVITGLVMLVGQGTIGVEYWTGIDPDPKVMEEALAKIFGV